MEFHNLMIKLQSGKNNMTSIQNIHCCISCPHEQELRRRFLGSNAHFSSQARFKDLKKYEGCWHVRALKDGWSFRTCHSALGHKIADKASTSTAGSSAFESIFQAFQEIARQTNWTALLHPLHLSAKNCKPTDSSNNKPLLFTEETKLSQFPTFSSSIFETEVTSDMGEVTTLFNLELKPPVAEEVNCQQAALSPAADELHVSLIPILEIPNYVGHASTSLQEILSTSFITDSQDCNPYNTVLERGKISRLTPHAEPCESTVRCITAEDLGSVEALADWLEERFASDSLQLSFWGKAPGTKSLSNLWCELVEGEISLEDSYPPKRTVHVASVHVTNESGNCLVEAYQEMSDGRIRQRNRPLSEKMKRGENVEDACLRGIHEELGQLGATDRVAIFQGSYRKREEERKSNSYPGLWTRYIIHTMSARIEQLPATEFVTIEDETHQFPSCKQPASLSTRHGDGSATSDVAVGVKRHFWKWI